MSDNKYDYDYLVIGGGSGGVSSGKRAALLYNKKVAVVEGSRWGGTCVNVGCVPKKIMYQAAHLRQVLMEDAKHYTFLDGTTNYKLDWPKLKERRDKYIVRLNNIYKNGLDKTGVEILEGWASFVDNHTVSIAMNDGSTKTVTAEYIVIATGGKPSLPASTAGLEHAITSDGFFELEEQPEKVVVVGAGYIAVELAGVMRALGSEVHLVVRKQHALRTFDPEIAGFLDKSMEAHDGVVMHRNTQGVQSIALDGNGKKTVTTVSGETIEGVDCVIMAAGREPNVDGLQLDKVGVKQHERKNTILVDDYQQTNVDNILALGDVCDKGVELTPMAIAAGRRLADRLFAPSPEDAAKPKASYTNVPTVVFSHPPIGTIGLTEPQAVEKYGADNLAIYKSTFVNLHYSMYDMEPSAKPKTLVKLICLKPTEKVVGLHLIGMAADEMLQGFAVAIQMGATKADLDSAVAIHPTASEEVVTLGTWGTSPLVSGAKESVLYNAGQEEATTTNPSLRGTSKM